MKLRRRPSKKARIEIIPMIDVIFFLLVFFMVSSLAMTRVNSLKVTLPKTASSAEALHQKAVLSIKRSGEIYVNQVIVTLDGLGAALAQVMRDDPQETVLVNADEGANYGTVIKVMDEARKIGVRKFALATDPASSSGSTK